MADFGEKIRGMDKIVSDIVMDKIIKKPLYK